MNKFIKGFIGDRYPGVMALLFALTIAFTSAAIAETQESVKSQVMSFAKKQAAVEITESAPSAAVEVVEPLAASAPVFLPPVSNKTQRVVPPAAAAVPAPVASGSEAQTKLQAIKTQEQWVAKLTKQLEGEKNQLNEMRIGLVQAFNLDPKKLEAGKYIYDTKVGKIVEGK